MASTQVARHRGHGEDSIYFATAKNRYVGSISLGYRSDGRRVRKKVFGQTKQEVRDKLKALHAELDAGIKSSPTYTVEQAVEDWLRDGLDGRSERTKKLYAGLMQSLMEHLGARPLRKLSASDVRGAMTQLAPRFSKRSLQITKNCLERAITHAQSRDRRRRASQPGVPVTGGASPGRGLRRQFLDIGTRLPTASNTHQVAQAVAADARVMYVDNDPIVLAHARSNRAWSSPSSGGRSPACPAQARPCGAGQD